MVYVTILRDQWKCSTMQHLESMGSLGTLCLGVTQFIHMRLDNDTDNSKENYLLVNLETRHLVPKVKQEHYRSPEEIWNK